MSTQKQSFKKNSVIYTGAVISFLILLMTVYFLPVEFSGYKNSDILAPAWYAITETGDWVGGIFVFIILLIYLTIHFKRASRKYSNLIFFITIVFFVQIFITGFSQFYAKNQFRKPRPNQVYFMDKGYITKGQEFFSMPSEEKRKYLQEKVRSDDENLQDIYPPILNRWISDSSFSFPSGHAQTSFFLGTIFAFVLYRTFSKKKKYFFIIPFVWAVLVALSRVVIGIHYPVDVAAGALIGMIAALLIISSKNVNSVFE